MSALTPDPLAALPPVLTTVTIRGESIELSPLRVGELPALLRVLQPIAHDITPEPEWLRLISAHGERVIEALAIASRRPPTWVAELALDQAVRLADAVFEVNADFFLQQLLPEISRVGQRLQVRLEPLNAALTLGPTPSPGCSVTAIATPTF